MPEISSVVDARVKLAALRDDILKFFAAIEEENKPQAQIGETPDGEEADYFEYRGEDASPTLTQPRLEAAEAFAH